MGSVQQISADTKDLDDIPRYWLQAQRLALPVVQYTARACSQRAALLGLRSATQRFGQRRLRLRIQQHLDRYGISLRDLVWQTDNGGEFKGDFPKALGDSQHVRIRPPLTPTRAMLKPFIVSKRTSSSTWKTSLTAAISSPRLTPTNSTSTWSALIRTRKI